MPSSIQDVIHQLDEIVSWSHHERLPLGYFPALYLRVNLRVAEWIQEGRFEDNERMERLGVVLATSYLDSFEKYRRGERLTRSWTVAFEAGQEKSYLVLQHIMVGMNALINLDLGVAAANVCPEAELESLKQDYLHISRIFGAVIQEVRQDLLEVSPWIGWTSRLSGKGDDSILRFSISEARKQAWQVARYLARTPKSGWPTIIDRCDREISSFGHFLLRPGSLKARMLLTLLHAREKKDPADVIPALAPPT